MNDSYLIQSFSELKPNVAFWRRFLDQKNFKDILSTNYHILVNTISENGSFNMKLLYRFDTPAFDIMAKAFSQLFYSFNVADRDILLPRMPEICTYMVINCLLSSHPKHSRLYNSCQFREILLDYFSELFTGIRLSNCRLHRDWLFATAIDQHVVVERPESIPEIKPNPGRGSNTTTYKMVNSPLVNKYMNLNENSVCTYGVNLSMSHFPERPLTTVQSNTGFHTKKARAKHIHHQQVKDVLKDSRKKLSSFSQQYEAQKKSSRQDINKLKTTLDYHMKIVNVEQREAMVQKKQEGKALKTQGLPSSK